MSEVHLAGEARKKIPACSQYGEDTGEREDAQKVGILGKDGQEEKKEKKDHNENTGWEDKHFVFEYRKQLSQVKENETHLHPGRKPRCLQQERR